MDENCKCSCEGIKTNCLLFPIETDSDNNNLEIETETKNTNKIPEIPIINTMCKLEEPVSEITIKTNKPKSELTYNEFKSQLSNDIALNVNPSKIIQEKDFIAIILSSDNMGPKEQIKNVISEIDLSNCINDIKI